MKSLRRLMHPFIFDWYYHHCTFQVTVGFLYEQYTIGYLEYHSMWQSMEFYIGIGVSVAVIIIIVIIVTIICCKARSWYCNFNLWWGMHSLCDVLMAWISNKNWNVRLVETIYSVFVSADLFSICYYKILCHTWCVYHSNSFAANFEIGAFFFLSFKDVTYIRRVP